MRGDLVVDSVIGMQEVRVQGSGFRVQGSGFRVCMHGMQEVRATWWWTSRVIGMQEVGVKGFRV